jgi:hypothetical protein
MNKVELGKEIRQGGSKTFNLEFVYIQEDGSTLSGNFVFKRPNVGEYIRIGVEKAKYLKKHIAKYYQDSQEEESFVIGVEDIDPTIRVLAEMMATLKIVSIEYPKWFKDPESLEDVSIIYRLYEEYNQLLINFRGENKQ